MDARFIVIEGLDGSGKSTQIRLLAEGLRALGRQPVVTAEPTESATGGLVRDALSGFTPRSGAEIAALFMADRVAHNTNPIWGIGTLLAQGKDVLCDRYYYSSLAYQGMVTDPDWVRRINLDCPEIRRPDLCVFLDVDYAACRRRMAEGSRAFLEIYENEAAMSALRSRYLDIFRALEGRDRVAIVNAAAPPEAVAQAVLAAVREIL